MSKQIKQKKWNLRNIKALCKALGEPQKSFESIHIAGTNGKGSTAFYTANILQAHGIKTGLFTSPHLVSIRERFKINSKMISQSELDSLLQRVENAAKAAKIEASFFELLTAVAFLWFKEKRVQVAVLEAGLGGRLDSTKIANGNIAAITSIGLDHTEMLGNTYEQILKEKLGILKKGATLILGNLPRKLISKCPAHIKAKKIKPELKTGNYGKIYAKNAELACAIAGVYLSGDCRGVAGYAPTYAPAIARAALKTSSWPGRMQMIYENKKLKIILDGAHNPAAAKEFAKCLKEKRIAPIPCIFSSLDDKDTRGVLKVLKPYISVCYPVQIESERARSAEDICKICEELKIKTATLPSIKKFVKNSKTPVLITGSLYLVGQAMFELSIEP